MAQARSRSVVLSRSLASCKVDLRLGLFATTKNRRYWKIRLVKLLDFSLTTSCLKDAQKLSSYLGQSVSLVPFACSLSELLLFKDVFSHNDLYPFRLACTQYFLLLTGIKSQLKGLLKLC